MITQERIDNIAKQLPTSWNELKLKDFYKLLPLKVNETDEFDNLFVGLDNTFSIITTLSNGTVAELEEIAMLSPQIARKVFDKILFFNTELPNENVKPSIKVKSIEEITYNDYVLFSMFYQKPLENLHLFIKTFSKDKITDEESLEISTEDAYATFFLVVNVVKKYTNSTIRSLKRKVLIQNLKKKFQPTP